MSLTGRADEAADEALGPCCACEGRVGVRHFVFLPVRGPAPGRGWGCVVCDLPMDGAVAVLCAACAETLAVPRFACAGDPHDEGRVAVDALTVPHQHDATKHEARA